jgi:hypothetical protein
MNWLIRRLAELKGSRRGAQIIVFDGAAEVERSRSFLRGALTGVGLSALVFAMAAPSAMDPVMFEEMQRRGELVQEAHLRVNQASTLIGTCLDNAEKLERTLHSYRDLLR